MRGPSNLQRRGGILYFRRGVPRALVKRLGRREIVVALKTGEHKLARLRANQLYVASERLFARLEGGMLSEETLSLAVQEFFELASNLDQMTRLTSGALSVEQNEAFLRNLEGHKADVAGDLGRGDYLLGSLGATAVIQRLGLTVDDLERRQLEQAIMRAGLDHMSNVQARSTGDFTREPADPLLRQRRRAATIQLGEGQSLRPERFKQASADDPARKLSKLSERFLENQQNSRLWDTQTRKQSRLTYKIFLELCGDRDLRDYKRADATKLRDTLQKLPADYGKSSIFKDASVEKRLEIDSKRDERVERLSTRTVKRHFSALSGLWRWAISEGLAAENPFQGFNFPSALRANEQRDMWTAEELKSLFASPVWMGARSHVHRTTPGDLVYSDEKYWLPIIALYSGLRLEEIAQLHLEDIRTVEGALVFDINSRPPRKLKNRNAVRKVPIHSRLKKLGLLKYLEELKGREKTLVFPNLMQGGADDRFGHSFTQWFTRYRRDVGVYRKGLDFHSFRHTATTALQRASVPIAAIDELTGHATPGETARYSHGLTMKQLVDAVESISYDLGPIKEPAEPLIHERRLKRRSVRTQRQARMKQLAQQRSSKGE